MPVVRIGQKGAAFDLSVRAPASPAQSVRTSNRRA
jgi:hypothetical protein